MQEALDVGSQKMSRKWLQRRELREKKGGRKKTSAILW